MVNTKKYCFSQNKLYLLYILYILSPLFAYAQLNVNSNITVNDVVQSMVGPGYTISKINYTCPQGGIGTFTCTSADLGISKGIIFTTGQAEIAKGPNNKVDKGFTNGVPGDSGLDSLLKSSGKGNYTTTDACGIEFDMVPACDSIKIKYVFGSEEYPENINKEFTDVFGFFISGPGINGTQNIATIPGTNTAISVQNINTNVNPNLYVNNTNGQNIQYDGFTKPLIAKAKVIPCSTYHLKIVIADVVDGIFDSGVFIEGSSIECSPVVYNELASNVNPIRNCKNGNFTFCRNGNISVDHSINYDISGTAINGVDYQTLSGVVNIPAGQKCFTTDVIPISSANPKPLKSIYITYSYGICPKLNTFRLDLSDPYPISAGPDVAICSGDSIKIGSSLYNSTYNYTWSPTTGLSNPNILNPIVKLTNTTGNAVKHMYVLDVKPQNANISDCKLVDTMYVTVNPAPTADFKVNPEFCLGEKTFFNDASTALPGKKITKWKWEFGNGLFDTAHAPMIIYATTGTYKVTLTAVDDNQCADDTTKQITIWPVPRPAFNFKSACIDDSVLFFDASTVTGSGVGSILTHTWNFGDNPSLWINGKNHSHLYPNNGITSYKVQLLVKTDKGCLASADRTVTLNKKPIVNFDAPPACLNTGIKFSNKSNATIALWDFGDGKTSTAISPLHKYPAVQTYSVKLTATNNEGCTDSIRKTVSIIDKPSFDYTVKDTAGCPGFCTSFTAAALPGSDPVTDWKWTFTGGVIKKGSTATHCFKSPGNFSPVLIGVSDKGCADTLSKPSQITVFNLPKAEFTITPPEITEFDTKVVIEDKSSADVVVWGWNLGDSTFVKNKKTIPHTFPVTPIAKTYDVKLVVVNSKGCIDSTVKSITMTTDGTVYIPNAFTPNDDNMNDIFRPFVTGHFARAHFKMYIFDRWGNKILTTEDINQGWNGTLKGEKCIRDVYVYKIIFTSKEDDEILGTYRGTVTLVN